MLVIVGSDFAGTADTWNLYYKANTFALLKL